MDKTIFQQLADPFPVEQVSWRIARKSGKAAMVLAFIDARDVMGRLDDVVGPDRWVNDYPIVGETTICRIGLKLDGEWVYKADGAGETDVEAEKGKLSDAFKRCAVRWGIGRYLYTIRDPNTGNAAWVDLDDNGNIAKHAYEYLYGLLPNGGGGLTQNTLGGQAKTPGKFWSLESFDLLAHLPKAHKDSAGEPSWDNPETVVRIYDDLHSAIGKAPTREALAKLQGDNMGWMRERLPAEDVAGIVEVFVARAAQFDQLDPAKTEKK